MISLFTQHKYRQAAWVIALPVLIISIITGVLIANRVGGQKTKVSSQPDATLDMTPYTQMSTAGLSRSTPIQALYQINVQANQTGWTPALHRQAAEQFILLDDLPSAIAHWEIIAAEDSEAAKHLADAYFEMGRWQAAIDAYLQRLSLTPEDAATQYQLGLMLVASNPNAAQLHLQDIANVQTYRQLASELIDVIQTNSGDPASNAMRVGQIFAHHELWPYAEQAFRYAFATSYAPLPEALAYTALMRLNQGKDGQEIINAASQLGIDSPQIQYVQGLYLRGTGAFEASRDAFAYAISLDPGNPLYYAELGNAYRLLLDYELAEYWLRLAVSVSANAPIFERRLAVFYAEEGYNLNAASLSALQQTRGIVPADPDLLAGFGWALHSAGDTTGGLAEIDAALAIAPENAQALYNKARILIEIENSAAALPLLRRVADGTSPYAEPAKILLEALDEE